MAAQLKVIGSGLGRDNLASSGMDRQKALEAALADILDDRERDLAGRLNGRHRQASRRVRELLQTQWEAAD